MTETTSRTIKEEQGRRIAADAVLAAAIADLAGRVTKLEGPPVVVPPIVPPAARPWPLPVTTRTVQIPPSIDATGATDVGAALRAFIAGVPDGSIITGGGPSAVYRHNGSFLPKSRNNLILDGQGATLRNVDTSGLNAGSSVYWSWLDKPFPSHLTFRNWIVKASNPTPGKLGAGEFAAFLHAMGGSFLELDNITASGLFGDLMTLNENPDHAWVHDSHVIDCGRNGVSVICGSHVLVERTAFDRVGYCGFDIEPEPGSIAGISDAIVRGNTFGTWGNCFVAIDGVNAGKPISDVTIDGNTVSGSSLLSVIGGSTARIQRLAFTNNASPLGGDLRFSHVDGLTVKGNGSAVATMTDCTGVQ